MQTGKDGGHMKNYVITVAREYGSGGKTIGKMLSEELGIKFYNDELLRLASDESGINEALFAKADENLKKPLILKAPKSVHTGEVIPPESDDFTSDQNLFNYLCKVIRQLADTESCVIVGRCADYILEGKADLLRVFIHADLASARNASCANTGNAGIRPSSACATRTSGARPITGSTRI